MQEDKAEYVNISLPMPPNAAALASWSNAGSNHAFPTSPPNLPPDVLASNLAYVLTLRSNMPPPPTIGTFSSNPPPPEPPPGDSNVPSFSNIADLIAAHPGTSAGSNVSEAEIATQVITPVSRFQWGNYFSYTSKTITDDPDGEGGSIVELNNVILLRDIGAKKLGAQFDAVIVDLNDGRFRVDADDEWWLL